VRAYTVTTAAVTLGIPAKWLDNVLSHHQVPGVDRSRQGVSRRITPQAILKLDIAIRLTRSLSVPIGRALELAEDLFHDTRGTRTEQGIDLTVDIQSMQEELTARLAHAVEIAPVPRRGRPSRS
jgi:hypothetical protein